jgi:hypothetical protein
MENIGMYIGYGFGAFVVGGPIWILALSLYACWADDRA